MNGSSKNLQVITLLISIALFLVYIAAVFTISLNPLSFKPSADLIISLLQFVTGIVFTSITIFIACNSYKISKHSYKLSLKVFQAQRQQLESQDFKDLHRGFNKRIKLIENEYFITIFTEGLIDSYLSQGRFEKGKYLPTVDERENIIAWCEQLNSFYEKLEQKQGEIDKRVPNSSLTPRWINRIFGQINQMGKEDPVFENFMIIPTEDLCSINGGANIPFKSGNPLYYADSYKRIIASLMVVMNLREESSFEQLMTNPKLLPKFLNSIDNLVFGKK